MIEYEILNLVSSNSSDLATMFTVYLSLLSAYIAAAYLVGAELSFCRLAVYRFSFYMALEDRR